MATGWNRYATLFAFKPFQSSKLRSARVKTLAAIGMSSSGKSWFGSCKKRRKSLRCASAGGYATAGRGAPSVTSTISGGTPRRNGMMLQPRPPETTTSQFILMWP